MSMIRLEIYRDGKLEVHDIEATGFLGPVVVGYKQLCSMRDGSKKPITQDLRDDIQAYEFILTSDDPDKFAKLYLEKKAEMRRTLNTYGISVRRVAKELGWV